MSYFFAADFTDFTEKTFKIRENLCNPWLFLNPNHLIRNSDKQYFEKEEPA